MGDNGEDEWRMGNLLMAEDDADFALEIGMNLLGGLGLAALPFADDERVDSTNRRREEWSDGRGMRAVPRRPSFTRFFS